MKPPIFAAIAARLAALTLAGAPAKWTDRDEYDMVLTIRGEAAPRKRVVLLDQWKAKYPKTDLQQVRQELYFGAYQSLGDGARMLEVAREMVAGAADNLVGLYWVTLLIPEAKEASPELLEGGEKASRQLLSGLDTYFAAGSKPAATDPGAWQKRRGEVELLAHRTLSWIAWQRRSRGSGSCVRRLPEPEPNRRRDFPGSNPCWRWTANRQIRCLPYGIWRAPLPTAGRAPCLTCSGGNWV